MNYYTRVWQNYVNFNGRDSRKQYWMFALFNAIISFALSFVAGLILGDFDFIVTGIYSLAILLPNIGLCIRRMHDIGKSGYWILLCFIPILGQIAFIVLCCMPSQQGENQYGSMPE